ncbi:MAG: helix-turn-helix domain-containing protein [Nitrosomonadales bacterium]|nr:helix-turn-helix domain-containing protein [Nitrosomonadales bacterium]
MRENTVAIIAFNGISPFHLSVPCAVFGEDRTGACMPKFELLVCSVEQGKLQTSAGFTIETRHGLKDLPKAATIIVPSWHNPAEPPPPALLQALQKAHRRGAQIVGLCLGSFVLAAAGLLDGRRATTHWFWSDELARRYPLIQVDSNVLYVDDGNIITSAGTAAAIDCCLHMLRQRYGAKVANQVARRMVVSPHRQGGQAQYIQQPVRDVSAIDHFARVLDWTRRNLDKPHSLDTLAEKALMTRRTFTRRFKQAMGITVSSWLLNQRLALAQQLLETTGKSIDAIAEKSGFGTPASLRQHFNRAFKISPSSYRREFRGK